MVLAEELRQDAAATVRYLLSQGGPAGTGIALVAAMAGFLVLLFAVPQARRILALELPPVSVCAWVAGVVLAAIAGLTFWRRLQRQPAR